MDKLKGREKALIFLSIIGEASAARLLESLPNDVAEKITNELNAYGEPAPEAVGLVLRELSQFSIEFEERKGLPGEVEAHADMEDVDSLSLLGRKKPEDLVAILQDEKKETIAMILSYLPEMKVENFLKVLSHGKRNEYRSLLDSIEKVPFTDELFAKANEVLISS